MGEQQVQTKIMKWLQDNDYYSVKTIVSNRKGVPDIIGCTPGGTFYGIEVKFGTNKASKLQEYNLAEIVKRGGIGILAYSLDDVKQGFGL